MAFDTEIKETDNTVWESKTYFVKFGRIVTMIDGLEAMRQAVEKALRTSRFSTPYYTAQYGNDLDLLIGKSIEYVKSDIERVIREALNDDRITEIEVGEPEQTDKTTLSVAVNVTTIFGDIQTEAEVITK